MAKITLNGEEIEAADGAPLVEVIKNSGTFISNLCYIDNLPPYAGCRTCLVEIEGARTFQLSCTTKVTDGMVVRTNTPEVMAARQLPLSLIMSYHPDRCLTCHRLVKCKPGDTCLRDGLVTHRCLTCSKNYRCELQTTCEMLQMAGYEPWDGEERTYYLLEPPPRDTANPFLEFDPQMCIICTRCVRACDEIRHTGAITLAGRGYSTRIEFGNGGPVHESSCDFCGTCIDVCPTATLMESPNKWAATETERWAATTCLQCSVGCTISLGLKKGRGVIIRPDSASNPFSRDQLCVRGRFHYDAIRPQERLAQPLIRRNGGQEMTGWEEAMDYTISRLAQVREEFGPDAIGFLGSPFATVEENYLVGKIGRAIVGTNNIDSSVGAGARAACDSLRAAFGSEVLPADMRRLEQSKTILVVADDLESSHNIACLRIKDAAVRHEAKVIVVTPRFGELNDFAAVWLRPPPGEEPRTTAALASAVQQALGYPVETQANVANGLEAEVQTAAELLASARNEEAGSLSIVFALPHFGTEASRAITAALANIAVACLGEKAPESLFILPQEANVWGLRDMGVSPEIMPGYRTVGSDASREELARFWGAPVAAAPGLTFQQMISDQGLRALVVLNDNPLMLAPDRPDVSRKLRDLDFLAVIDEVKTDTAALADVVFPEIGPWSKEGAAVSADRRVLRMRPTTTPVGTAQPGWRILSELGQRLAQKLDTGEIRINYPDPEAIMDEISQLIPLYKAASYSGLDSGQQQSIDGLGPKTAQLQPVAEVGAPEGDGFVLTTSRSLFTSYEGAAIHSPEADKLHREETVEIHPDDAAELGVAANDQVEISNALGRIVIRVHPTDSVQRRHLYVPLYYDGGVAGALFGARDSAAAVQIRPA